MTDDAAMNLRSSAGFARAILIWGGGTEEHAVRRATRVGRGAKPPSELRSTPLASVAGDEGLGFGGAPGAGVVLW
jgi:hypothetical protein